MQCPVISRWESERQVGVVAAAGQAGCAGSRDRSHQGEQVLKFVRLFSPYSLFYFLLLGNICVIKEKLLKWRNYFHSVKTLVLLPI